MAIGLVPLMDSLSHYSVMNSFEGGRTASTSSFIPSRMPVRGSVIIVVCPRPDWDLQANLKELFPPYFLTVAVRPQPSQVKVFSCPAW